jgi:hypothetical protein
MIKTALLISAVVLGMDAVTGLAGSLIVNKPPIIEPSKIDDFAHRLQTGPEFAGRLWKLRIGGDAIEVDRRAEGKPLTPGGDCSLSTLLDKMIEIVEGSSRKINLSYVETGYNDDGKPYTQTFLISGEAETQ